MLEVLNLQIILTFFLAVILVALICWYLELSLKVFYIVISIMVIIFVGAKVALFFLL